MKNEHTTSDVDRRRPSMEAGSFRVQTLLLSVAAAFLIVMAGGPTVDAQRGAISQALADPNGGVAAGLAETRAVLLELHGDGLLSDQTTRMALGVLAGPLDRDTIVWLHDVVMRDALGMARAASQHPADPAVLSSIAASPVLEKALGGPLASQATVVKLQTVTNLQLFLSSPPGIVTQSPSCEGECEAFLAECLHECGQMWEDCMWFPIIVVYCLALVAACFAIAWLAYEYCKYECEKPSAQLVTVVRTDEEAGSPAVPCDCPPAWAEDGLSALRSGLPLGGGA